MNQYQTVFLEQMHLVQWVKVDLWPQRQILSGLLVTGHLHSSSQEDRLAEWSFSVPITHIFDLKRDSGGALATDYTSVMGMED